MQLPASLQTPAYGLLGTAAYEARQQQRLDYGFERHMMPCLCVNPQLTTNLKSCLEYAASTCEVVGSGMPTIHRKWAMVGLDGALYIRAKKMTEQIPALQNLVIISALVADLGPSECLRCRIIFKHKIHTSVVLRFES